MTHRPESRFERFERNHPVWFGLAIVVCVLAILGVHSCLDDRAAAPTSTTRSAA